MSGTTTSTGNGATQQAPPRAARGGKRMKAGAKRTRRTQAQIAAAAAGVPGGIPAKAPAMAFPAIQPTSLRLASIVQLFSECTDAERARNLAAVSAIWPAKAA
jgi:hypothetical protein